MFLGKPFAILLKIHCELCLCTHVYACMRVRYRHRTLELRDPQWSLRFLVLLHRTRNKPEEHPYLYNGSLGICLVC